MFWLPPRLTDDSLQLKLFDDSKLGSHNAATYYYRACLKWASLPKSHRVQLNDHRKEWLLSPFAALPKAEVEAWLRDTDSVFKELDRGLSGTCNWGLEGVRQLDYAETVELDKSAELTVLPELAEVLRLKARLHIARSEYAAAAKTLADTVKLARDVEMLPGLLPVFASNNISYRMLAFVNEMASTAGSPNMLRALQTLPRPLADYQSAVRDQYKTIERSFGFLDSPETSTRNDKQWRSVFLDGIAQIDRAHRSTYESTHPNGWDELVASRTNRLGLLMGKLYPSAKQELLSAGWEKKDLDSMPVGKVIAIQTRRLWDKHTSLLAGLENLTAAEIRDRSKKMQSSDLVYGELLGGFPLHTMITNQENLLLSRNLLVEVSMNMELLRNHLAAAGKFPTVEQFKAMNPLPDPTTGLPFQYRRLENGDAQIQSQPDRYDELAESQKYVRVRFTFKKAEK